MTYQEWLDVKETNYISIDYDDLGMIIGECELALVIDKLALVNDQVNILQKRLSSQGSFNWKANKTKVEELISKYPAHQTLLQSLIDALNEKCIKTIYPNGGKTEADWIVDCGLERNELNVPCDTSLKVLTLSIDKQPPQQMEVKVYHRLSSDGKIWSDWIHCQTFCNVQYAQETHSKTVSATTAKYREMKAVCDFEVGMAIK